MAFLRLNNWSGKLLNGYVTIVTSYDTKGTNHYLLGTAVKFTIELAPYKCNNPRFSIQTLDDVLWTPIYFL